MRHLFSVLALTIAFHSCPSGDAVAQSQTVSCESLDLRVGIESTGEPECMRGWNDGGDLNSGWQFFQSLSDDRLVRVVLYRAGRRTVLSRPSLKGAIEDIVWESDAAITWDDELDDPDYDLRRFDISFKSGEKLLCVGFLQIENGPSTRGSDIKQAIYGLICNKGGPAFAASDVSGMMRQIHD
jgi:hypothetical protein